MRYYSDKSLYTGMWIVVVLVIIFSAVVSYQKHYSNPHWETITVTEKNINPGHGKSSSEKWLVYTENEVYCITDLFFVGFFTSSDVYNHIKVGKTYKVYVSGKRMPFFSGYKVIRQAEWISEQ